ncbi:MAG: hypothetical protein M0R40_11205 [Firmicutes bacterium]|nr:hypothetical protein [Bacillota bacterium]
MKHYVNLDQVANRRMFFPAETEIDEKKIIGVHGCFFKEEEINFEKPFDLGNVSFLFRKSSALGDSVECNNQLMNIPEFPCRKIHFAGLCEWGYFKEKAELLFSDGSVDYAKINFSDICWPLQDAAVRWKFGKEKDEFFDASRILLSQKGADRDRFIYHYSTTFSNTRTLVRIRFPDNILMVVMAVTVEDEYG